MEPKNRQFKRLTGLQKSVVDHPNVLSRANDSMLSERGKGTLGSRAFERNMAEMDTFNNAERSIKDLDKEYKALPEDEKEHGVAVIRGGALARVRGGNLPSIVDKDRLNEARKGNK
jgi:hypothetical protein